MAKNNTPDTNPNKGGRDQNKPDVSKGGSHPREDTNRSNQKK